MTRRTVERAVPAGRTPMVGVGSRVRAVSLMVIGVTLVAVVVGCGSSSSSPSVATTVPQTAPSAPPGTAVPAGTVVPASAGRGLVVDARTRQVAALDAAGRSVEVYSAAAQPVRIRTVVLNTPAAAIADLGDGRVGAIGEGVLARIDLATGAVLEQRVPVSRPLSIAYTSAGTVLVGTADGTIVDLGPDGAARHRITGLVRVDAIAVWRRAGKKDQVVALDRAQSAVTMVDVDKSDLGVALRVGDGATTLTVDRFGRFLSSDTRDDQVVVFAGDPLVSRIRYPVAPGPYAVGFDDTRGLMWVVANGANQAIAYDLSTGIPVEKRRVATVGQADSLVVDSSSGLVFVLSSRGEGLQAIS
ncbi:hypothetical protein [Williamsia sp. CHRR-6]|uniref:hypothetical protein n=1 Tax=Williamsia sp. CHRR-6 TaxID=2835871 RepID=UPI001BDB1CFA|nr:hypothetical protein [Williamsia sp. CHRR-6]MBT0568096.1 hypothetical protein [Williamsia sp. CHRR-6]